MWNISKQMTTPISCPVQPSAHFIEKSNTNYCRKKSYKSKTPMVIFFVSNPKTKISGILSSRKPDKLLLIICKKKIELNQFD